VNYHIRADLGLRLKEFVEKATLETAKWEE